MPVPQKGVIILMYNYIRDRAVPCLFQKQQLHMSNSSGAFLSYFMILNTMIFGTRKLR